MRFQYSVLDRNSKLSYIIPFIRYYYPIIIQLNNSNLKKILRYRKTSFNLGVLQSNSKKIVIESLRKKLGTDATSRPHLQRKEFVTELRFIRVNRFLSIHSIFVGHGSLSFSLSLSAVCITRNCHRKWPRTVIIEISRGRTNTTLFRRAVCRRK